MRRAVSDATLLGLRGLRLIELKEAVGRLAAKEQTN
jgi:hypothetical protein